MKTRSDQAKPGWPANVRTIAIDGLDHLGVDDSGALYWDGKRVATVNELKLTQWQTVGAVVGVVSALSMAAFDALRFFGFGASG